MNAAKIVEGNKNGWATSRMLEAFNKSNQSEDSELFKKAKARKEEGTLFQKVTGKTDRAAKTDGVLATGDTCHHTNPNPNGK